MKILITCGAKFHSDQLAYQLQKRGLLYRVISSYPFFVYSKRNPINKKYFYGVLPLWILPFLFHKFGAIKKIVDYVFSRSFDFAASLRAGYPDVSISWAWSALTTMKCVKKRGGIAMLEQCGSFSEYQYNLLKEEYLKLNLDFKNVTDKRVFKIHKQEIILADYIVCPSTYVANTIAAQGIDYKKIIIIPYGVNLEAFTPEPKSDNIFRILFVGTVGVRKGLIYLFKALEDLNLPNFECLIIGRLEPCFEEIFSKYKKYFKHIPRVEHNELRYFYSNASLFVFPSLDEGMAYVQLEAMACGLPVICTFNSGAEGVIRDGKEGYVVPIRNSEIIKERIKYLYENPLIREEMGRNSLKRSSDYTWETYSEKLITILQNILDKKNYENHLPNH